MSPLIWRWIAYRRLLLALVSRSVSQYAVNTASLCSLYAAACWMFWEVTCTGSRQYQRGYLINKQYTNAKNRNLYHSLTGTSQLLLWRYAWLTFVPLRHLPFFGAVQVKNNYKGSMAFWQMTCDSEIWKMCAEFFTFIIEFPYMDHQNIGPDSIFRTLLLHITSVTGTCFMLCIIWVKLELV